MTDAIANVAKYGYEESAMKFLCLICAEKVMEQMPSADADAHFAEYTRFTDDIRRSGHFIDCNRLQPPGAATTVRVRNGKLSTVDGPFAETKELLGGYAIVEVASKAEAIALSREFLQLHVDALGPGYTGVAEIREMMALNSFAPVQA